VEPLPSRRSKDLAVAFRSTVISPSTIIRLAKQLDNFSSLSHVFIPEGSRGGFTSLDICSASLGVSERLQIGSGVIRVVEHDPELLARRLLTLQEMSGNRFVLGIGTGPATSDPLQTIRSMLDGLRSTREMFKKLATDAKGLKMPEIFIATLRKGIAKAVVGQSDGILLNFCTPEHVRNVLASLGNPSQRIIISCYLKIFFSRDQAIANRMLIEEFANYDRIPSYHKMFESAGVAEEIKKACQSLGSKLNIAQAEKLQRISLANPTSSQLAEYVGGFRDAGVNLPCLYPYFEQDEDEAFKIKKVEEIVRL
jgi:luciferase-like monooxygenase